MWHIVPTFGSALLFLPLSASKFSVLEESWHLSPCAPIEQSGWRMSEQEMISVAFITPICLLTLTSLVLVARIGVKAAVTRAFELEDGKQTRQRASAPCTSPTRQRDIIGPHLDWGPTHRSFPSNTRRYLGGGGQERVVSQDIMCTMVLRNTRLIHLLMIERC